MNGDTGVARLYIRDFPDAENVDRMAASVDLQVRHRISGVNASLLVWHHRRTYTHDGVMAPKNQIFTLDLIYQSDSPDF